MCSAQKEPMLSTLRILHPLVRTDCCISVHPASEGGWPHRICINKSQKGKESDYSPLPGTWETVSGEWHPEVVCPVKEEIHMWVRVQCEMVRGWKMWWSRRCWKLVCSAQKREDSEASTIVCSSPGEGVEKMEPDSPHRCWMTKQPEMDITDSTWIIIKYQENKIFTMTDVNWWKGLPEESPFLGTGRTGGHVTLRTWPGKGLLWARHINSRNIFNYIMKGAVRHVLLINLNEAKSERRKQRTRGWVGKNP